MLQLVTPTGHCSLGQQSLLMAPPLCVWSIFNDEEHLAHPPIQSVTRTSQQNPFVNQCAFVPVTITECYDKTESYESECDDLPGIPSKVYKSDYKKKFYLAYFEVIYSLPVLYPSDRGQKNTPRILVFQSQPESMYCRGRQHAPRILTLSRLVLLLPSSALM